MSSLRASLIEADRRYHSSWWRWTGRHPYAEVRQQFINQIAEQEEAAIMDYTYQPATNSLTITPERVREAAASCPDARRILDKLFPGIINNPTPKCVLPTFQHADVTEVNGQRFVVMDRDRLEHALLGDPQAKQFQIRVRGDFGVGAIMRAFRTSQERIIARNGKRIDGR